MSMIPSTSVGSLAGIPVAQAKGTETDRAIRETANKVREITSEKSAEDAAGIGTTEEESAAGERDGDGRQVLEQRRARPKSDTVQPDSASSRAKDPAGQSGTQLDLDG